MNRGRLVPETKPMLLCNDVLVDPSTGNIHLMGAFNEIRPRGQTGFPHRHAVFCVFIQLTDAEGEIPGFVQVVEEASLELVYQTPSYRISFPDRLSLVRVCFRIRDCTFPGPGIYWIQLFCKGQFVTDRVLRLLEPG
jgi:hypothetical protein